MKYNQNERRKSALSRREKDMIIWADKVKSSKDEGQVKYYNLKLNRAKVDCERLKEKIV